MTNEVKIKKIAYGISNYRRIIEENCYYVDKTMYIKAVEAAGDYLFFIRPRRFGKSLFISVLEAYYDISLKARFDFFFKDTWIYHNQTSERNSYLILSMNFSEIGSNIDQLEKSFYYDIIETGDRFISKYKKELGVDEQKSVSELKTRENAPDALRYLISLARKSGRKLYVIIDEYDNFANTVLTARGTHAYQRLTRGEGFFRSFFNVLKAGTTGIEAPVTRLFITGVSPVTMDDVTSGFNIGDNISLAPVLNSMIGFTRSEVREMLDYYHNVDYLKHEPGFLLEMLEKWYGNYNFSEYSPDGERLFNSDMILYFFKEYFRIQHIPDELVDRNVRIDYGKLRHLIVLDRGDTKTTNGNFSKLKEIIEEGGTSSIISRGFPLEEMMNANNFKSLLYYFGLLTIKGAERDKLRLEIPNETVRRLYYDYIKDAYRETGVFALDLSKYEDLMTNMAYDGEWQPLFDYLSGRIRESMSLRDLITGEKSIQAFLNVYLGLSNLFMIHTEKEMNKGYADIVMEPLIAVYKDIKYSYVLEIKYIKPEGKRKKKPSAVVVEKLRAEAEEQLKIYSLDEKFRKSMEGTEVRTLTLIFYGSDLVFIG
ncbi:MAG: AAA family ATPase [Candidatus Omnitrophota bacterium]